MKEMKGDKSLHSLNDIKINTSTKIKNYKRRTLSKKDQNSFNRRYIYMGDIFFRELSGWKKIKNFAIEADNQKEAMWELKNSSIKPYFYRKQIIELKDDLKYLKKFNWDGRKTNEIRLINRKLYELRDY